MTYEVPVADIGFKDDAVGIVEFFAKNAGLSFKNMDLGEELLDGKRIRLEHGGEGVVLRTEEVVHERSDKMEVAHDEGNTEVRLGEPWVSLVEEKPVLRRCCVQIRTVLWSEKRF